jgi:large subunit ribosomal protein L5
MNLNTEEFVNQLKTSILTAFGKLNIMAYPKLSKISINVGCGAGSNKKYDTKDREAIAKYLEKITGQKAALVASNKSISGFKLRAGEVVGVKVTLRGRSMYDFLIKLIYVALPRTRDFRGLSAKHVDKSGNYSLGIRSSTIFPEVGFDAEVAFGMQVNFVFDNIKADQTETMIKLLKLPIV